MKVTDKDKGLKRVLHTAAQLSRSRGAGVKVGIQGQAAQRTTSGPDNIQIGIWNEFGTADGRVPERSFLRGTVDQNAEKYAKVKEKLAGQVVDGHLALESALALLGEVVVKDVRARIVAGIPPPNAPSTVAAKGSSTPLINTGQLVRSITYQVVVEAKGTGGGR